MTFNVRLCFVLVFLLNVCLANIAPLAAAPERGKKLTIKDYRKRIHSKFKKRKRLSTRFIIVHTSEAGLASTLGTSSRGKKVRRNYRTYGGHAHYVIARNGLVYRILSHRYRADHAGLSMWNGIEDISSHSLGIELVGFHYGEITRPQYNSLKKLVKILRKTYRIPGKNVLTHSQVSYGKANQWHKRIHRGRKRCGLNFDRARIGLQNQAWTYDPDVKSGRLSQDRQIHTVFYKPFKYKKRNSQPTPTVSTTPASLHASLPKKNNIAKRTVENSNIIGINNTAWNIAGEDFNSPSTLYILPDGRQIRGSLIKKRIGWGHLPKGTKVQLYQSIDRVTKKGPVFQITNEISAWSIAGKDFKKSSTFYFFADGKILPGTHIADWDSFPNGTNMIVGYRLPVTIKARKGRTPWAIAGKAHNQKNTVYYVPALPGKPVPQLFTGDKINNFSKIPKGTRVFVKLKIRRYK
ncbi:MAG: N-acetylmuramoyl-L-alanine amidase [bacterium]|nr:N-acetylmuramoyl-L-alanine amidase [bacterium]